MSYLVANPEDRFSRDEAHSFWSFGVNAFICGCFEYTIPLKDLLGGVSSVAH